VAQLEHQPAGLPELRAWWEQESRRPTGGSPAARFAQLVRRRTVLWMLVVRDLKKKYENSYLGYAWALLEPASLIAVYWLVWGHVSRLHISNYILFIATAMMPWLWFRNAVMGSSGSIAGNARLVSSINLPREIYPIALAITEGIEYLGTLPVVWVLALIYRVPPSPRFLLILPVAIFLELILVVGAALLMSALTTLFRDVERVLGSFMRVLFYLTPVIYPSGRLHGALHTIFVIDPLVGIFNLNRAVFFPGTQLTFQMMAISVIGSVVMFVVGWAVFIRLEHSMLKEL
jgi:ABC-2 type transport system permease protein